MWREIRIALGLSIGAALALGLSRFAYGLLLPPMRADLGWTYVEAGALNTANGLGYIGGALVSALAASRWGVARTFLAGFLISVAVLLLTAETRSFALLFALRSVGGISTAVTFILGAGLTTAICPAEEPRRRGTLVGLYVAGVGIGMLLPGAAIPVILEAGAQQWPTGWAALGLMGVAGLPIVWWRQQRADDLVLARPRPRRDSHDPVLGARARHVPQRPRSGADLRGIDGGHAARPALDQSDSDVRLCSPVRRKLPRRASRDDHRGPAPAAGLILDGGHLAHDRGLCVRANGRPYPRRRDLGRDGQDRGEFLALGHPAGARSRGEPAATAAVA